MGCADVSGVVGRAKAGDIDSIRVFRPIGDLVLKFVCALPNGPLKKALKRLRLYHPSLRRLMELSEGDAESLVVRSKEFSELLRDLSINGVYKHTGSGRLAALDEWAGSVLPHHPSALFRMLDVGASDGSTTLDTVRYFKKKYGVEVKATILEMQLRLHCFRRGFLWYYLTHCHSPLLVQIGPLGLLFEETTAREGPILNPVIRAIKRRFKRLSLERYMDSCGDILLASPMVKNSPDIIWLERDLLQFDPALIGTFDFIRCSNVLNYCYFSEARIYDAVRLLALYLKKNGSLLLSRTMEHSAGPLDHASLWMKNGENLQHVSDLNGGSEIKRLVPVSGLCSCSASGAGNKSDKEGMFDR